MKVINARDQNGLVSIMVASVLMIIMALITLGFTRIVQSEQRQAVDNQLSRQAFYAAESGINVAASSPGFPGGLKDDCVLDDYDGGTIEAGNSDVVFTCLKINPTPTSLVFGNDSITTNKSKVVPIRTNPDADSLIFEWNDTQSNNVLDCSSNLTDFEQLANWDKIAAMRLDLIGIPNSPTFGRNEIINNQFNAIFYPCANVAANASVAYSAARGAGNVGKIIPVNCGYTALGEDYDCRITITNINPGNTFSEHFARFNSIYGEANVRIRGVDSSGNETQFANAQAVVDSTGRAVDVFRRLQARVPLYDAFINPNASIQTLDDICKDYEVTDTAVVDHCQTP